MDANDAFQAKLRVAVLEKIAKFWSWFVANEPLLKNIRSGRSRCLDQLVEELYRIDPGLFCEISDAANPDPKELIITAEGKRELFPLVESVVRSAPELKGWRFIALKPPRGVDFVTAYEDITIDPRKLWFLPMFSRSNPESLGLRIALPDFDANQSKKLKNAILIVLDTVLGERMAACVRHLEIAPLLATAEGEGYMELAELSDYLRWRNSRDGI